MIMDALTATRTRRALMPLTIIAILAALTTAGRHLDPLGMFAGENDMTNTDQWAVSALMYGMFLPFIAVFAVLAVATLGLWIWNGDPNDR